MRSLYVRIVFTFVVIAVISGIVGLLLTSLYYENKLEANNERKIVEMGQSIRSMYEQDPEINLDAYLRGIAALGFQIYAVDENMKGNVYGAAFKHGALSSAQIRTVLDGSIYYGMREENTRLKIFSFFENSMRNTVGMPLQTRSGKIALFVRPDLEKQIGEIRIIVAVLLGVTFIASLVLIVVLTRLIVRPIKMLKKATLQIVKGNFNVGLEAFRNRKDEIGDLSHHFAQMAQSIRQLDQMRQEFVANVSHEFQTPLTSIQGFARAVLHKEVTPEQSDQYLAIIEAESSRLSSLSKQLLKLAALDKENKELQLTTFRLDEQIRQIIIMLEWQWTDKQLHLDLNLPEISITADSQLLYEVWLNLISNGINFSEPGDTITIEILDKDEVIVEIRDTGIGIPEAEVPFIFERFHKADKARNRSSTGSGLGLAIVHKIVSLHQGDIQVRSEHGVGTAFTVTLPHL
ncbi:sensor histidine kinase [Cohnella silvisoli]|uniref:Heme sensor protein HssS n=1 Tax=Cohnella silvisoli TaxID=2873699 RepID=A0ABV1KN32_9BACL|nr:sensor histidine kinase [Cohnella silvisoli]MCD9020427.1 HAMP domain-containing protein [Cohnella silvisoli]